MRRFFIIAMMATLPLGAFASECDHELNSERLNSCLGDAFSKSDGELNFVYKKIRSKLTNDEKLLLKKAQVLWLSFRDASCDFEASSVDGGTAYQAVYIDCQSSLTKSRIAELKRSSFWPVK